jgi:iron complex transport system substrate-binding protein
MTSRRALVGAMAGLVLLAACAAPGASLAPEASQPPASVEPSAPAAAAFPVTIEHKYGETVITEEPQRIVTVGLVEQDALLALGVVPVATTEWFGEYPGSIWPWAQEALGDVAPPESVGTSAEVNIEAILDQDPDLVLALYSGLTEEQYDTLSAQVPTVAQPADLVDYGIGWEELTITVGRAVGKQAEAEALVADVEAQFAAAQEEHPEFVGASAVVATPYEGVWVYGPEDARGRFLTALGFELPPDLVEVTGEEFGGTLSPERADLLDLDVVVWLDAEAVEDYGGPVYETFAVHTEAREVFLDSFSDPLGGATSFVTVLSIPYLLDGLVPKLAAAVDGDPTTEVP